VPNSTAKGAIQGLKHDAVQKPVAAMPLSGGAQGQDIHGLFNGGGLCSSNTKEKPMFVRVLTVVALCTTILSSAQASRPRDREQDTAFHGAQQGRFLPLRAIEARIVPRMRGFDYLGPELDAAAGRYRLKFMRGPKVVWIDVDARTGEVIGRSGF